MKYAQLIMGLLVGTALGGAVVASQGGSVGSTANPEEIKQIVRDTISEEGKLILESVQKFQMAERNKSMSSANEALKDADLKEAIYNDANVAFVGPADSTRVVAEFFDYNCPACKMQYKALAEVIAKDKDVKVVFHEYPIFGPQSETNSKLGLSVFHVAPEKYLAFHDKMMTHEGRVDEKAALGFIKELGIDVKKVQAFAASEEAAAELEKSRALGSKLNVQGTPTLVIGEEVIPHAAPADEIEAKLGK